jgi:hypothetical protein
MRKYGVLLVTAISANLFGTPSAILSANNECIQKPGSSASGHWYYRADPVTGRKCWFVGQPDAQVQHPAKPRQISTKPTQASIKPKQNTSTTKGRHPTSSAEKGGKSDPEEKQQNKVTEEPNQQNASPEAASREVLFREFVLWEMLQTKD